MLFCFQDSHKSKEHRMFDHKKIKEIQNQKKTQKFFGLINIV